MILFYITLNKGYYVFKVDVSGLKDEEAEEKIMDAKVGNKQK
nr:hypothetical protein [Clostridium chromiireducens]